MDYNQIFAISAAGMNVERTRVEVASMNLANANTLQSTDGSGYQPMQVIARSGSPASRFAHWIDADDDGTGGIAGIAASVPSISVVPAESQPKMVYEPANPFADEKGFIRYPGVDTAAETLTMMTAMHAYAANVAALNTTRNLALKTLDIGG